MVSIVKARTSLNQSYFITMEEANNDDKGAKNTLFDQSSPKQTDHT